MDMWSPAERDERFLFDVCVCVHARHMNFANDLAVYRCAFHFEIFLSDGISASLGTPKP